MISPNAIQLGFINITWYGIIYFIGFLFSFFYIKHQMIKMNIKEENTETFFIYFTLFSLLGARLFEIFFYNFEYFRSNPIKIFAVWQGGMSVHGAMLFGFLTIICYCRKNKINYLKLTDIIVVPLSLGLAFGRLANFINQELVGIVTKNSIGIVFSAYDNNKRLPYQLFEGFKNLIIFQVLFFIKTFKETKDGFLTALFIITYSSLRFIIDFTKEIENTSKILFMPVGHFFSLIYLIIGLILLIKLITRKNILLKKEIKQKNITCNIKANKKQ